MVCDWILPFHLGVRRHLITGGKTGPTQLIRGVVVAIGISGNVVSPILRRPFNLPKERQAIRKESYWRRGYGIVEKANVGL